MRKINPISEKRARELIEYNVLVDELRRLCGNRSELSGEWADWQTCWNVEPHHIRARIGKRFLNPFGIIMLTRNEHTIENDHKEGCHIPEELEAIVRPLRIKQGFKKE